MTDELVSILIVNWDTQASRSFETSEKSDTQQR
jgi:hypothetical protein